jgi:hypothetical protein
MTTHTVDPTPAPTARTNGPNHVFLNAILRRISSSAQEVARELSINPRTTAAFFSPASSKRPAQHTFDVIADHLRERLIAAGVATALTGEMLRASFPAENLPAPLRALLAAPACPPCAIPSGGFHAHPTRELAEDALFRYVEHTGHSLKDAEVTVVAFSPHRFTPFIGRLMRQKVGRVRLCVGSPALALKLDSRRQAYLIDDELDREYQTDWGRDRLCIVRYNVPPPFHGYHVKGVAVCVGNYGWFPNLCGCESDAEVAEYKAALCAADVRLSENNDSLTLNGHLMAHVQAFPGPDYDVLACRFDLQVRALELFHARNPNHDDFRSLRIENPKAGARHEGA